VFEQALPPRDLLESLQNGVVELQKKTRRLEKKVSELKKVLEKSEANKKSSKSFDNNYASNQEQIIRGLVSLQSGNPDQAVEHLQDILNSKKATKIKGEILMAIGNGFSPFIFVAFFEFKISCKCSTA
jgi:predicted RNase H-like nuclease (RuvC/YqgF family)